uniref:Uncharacterized protein n=1 Tax=Aplanochytrium stocchinoi TaxID=215587 RepID=A0A6S8CZ83_9STRA|mmetsp:Transcript_11195/g.13998  ORF Transcript_11195/g.13998 Transcript_11195/m.13998 type:complete len:121 (+) Transcript_11195:272-634(+)
MMVFRLKFSVLLLVWILSLHAVLLDLCSADSFVNNRDDIEGELRVSLRNKDAVSAIRRRLPELPPSPTDSPNPGPNTSNSECQSTVKLFNTVAGALGIIQAIFAVLCIVFVRRFRVNDQT